MMSEHAKRDGIHPALGDLRWGSPAFVVRKSFLAFTDLCQPAVIKAIL
jgi:hypothetical protein